ncbi:CehA/McbA family metallohydrolase [Spongiibacter sp. KMU-166]|uniref:CehA/McbA family metallohydrolase n=1 Tax=Spongiibacter thalassae TaxID=2721624 RepID=A0ABX1GMB4_9GAMM|nr:CehA/McbA family metallohydrolase [Spongiibacter thalassae]
MSRFNTTLHTPQRHSPRRHIAKGAASALLALSCTLAFGAKDEAREAPVADGLDHYLEEASQEDAAPPSLLRAERITLAAIDSYPRSGPDAIAGVGDWWLSNGVVCAAISDVDHDAGIVAGGGSLIDLGHCNRDDDQWTYANVLTGLSKDTAIPVRHINASLSDDAAEIIATGEREGLRQTVRFRLGADSDRLEIDVELVRIGEGPALQMSGLFTLYSNRVLSPFSYSSYAPNATLGFQHKDIDRHSTASLIRGMMPADWNILVGEDNGHDSISYGLQLMSAELINGEGARQTLPRFLAVLPNYSLHGWLTRPLWIQSDRLNWLSMLQSRFMDLEPREKLIAKFQVLLGRRNDVASITDQIYRGPVLRGYSNHNDVSFTVWDQQERPVTQVRPQQDGSFTLRLPDRARRVRVTANAPWGQQLAREIAVADNRNDSGRWMFRRNGSLTLPRGEAMSLYFFGLGDTPNPRFGDDLLGFSIGDSPLPSTAQRNRIDLAGIPSDPEVIDLAPGNYQVLVGRGMEYELREYLLTVIAGKRSLLPIQPPKRLWFGEDWRSADLHVHSGASFDATVSIRERLRSYVAQGAEILLASEHNRIVDYRPVVSDMGLENDVQVMVGAELTSMAHTEEAPYTIGHSNAFPLRARPNDYAGGIFRTEGRALRELIAEVKGREPGALFQLNHPRAVAPDDQDLAFFDHLSIGKRFNADQPLDASDNRSLLAVDPVSGARDIDFDLLEVINGSEFAVYEQVRNDWFALLNQGARRAATGNSDSHDLSQVVAAPRNYIYLPDSGPLPLSEQAIVKALSSGQSFATTGPFLELTLRQGKNTIGLGGYLHGREGQLHVRVSAADWVDVDLMTIWVNGEIYRELRTFPGDHKVVEIVADKDSWLVVEVRGKAGELYRKVLPDLQPLALSNPIYIDANNDGRWQAPLN